MALLKDARLILARQAEALGVPPGSMPQPPRAPARSSPAVTSHGVAFDPYKVFTAQDTYWTLFGTHIAEKKRKVVDPSGVSASVQVVSCSARLVQLLAWKFGVLHVLYADSTAQVIWCGRRCNR